MDLDESEIHVPRLSPSYWCILVATYKIDAYVPNNGNDERFYSGQPIVRAKLGEKLYLCNTLDVIIIPRRTPPYLHSPRKLYWPTS